MKNYQLKSTGTIGKVIVTTYKIIETSVVASYKRIETKFINRFLKEVEEPTKTETKS